MARRRRKSQRGTSTGMILGLVLFGCVMAMGLAIVLGRSGGAGGALPFDPLEGQAKDIEEAKHKNQPKPNPEQRKNPEPQAKPKPKPRPSPSKPTPLAQSYTADELLDEMIADPDLLRTKFLRKKVTITGTVDRRAPKLVFMNHSKGIGKIQAQLTAAAQATIGMKAVGDPITITGEVLGSIPSSKIILLMNVEWK